MFRWVATMILLWFIYQVRHVFPPIIVGGIIAYLVLPVVQALSVRLKVPTGIATAIVYFFMLAGLSASVYFLGPSIMKELKELSNPENQHELVHKAIEQVTGIVKYQGDIDQLTEQVLTGIVSSVTKPEELSKGVGEISHLALSVLVCVVSSIYFTLDSQSVGRFFLRYVPEVKRPGVIELFAQMNKMLSKYVQGQILLILIMSVVAWLFLHFFLHMKYALPVAVFSGFLEIIPVLGPILATSTATLVGIAQFGPHAALQIVVFYTLARWIEDYVVVPKIIGHAVELHPLAVIFAVLCGETLAGGLGMLIAIPVAACIKLVLDYYYEGQLPAERPRNKKHHGAKAVVKPQDKSGDHRTGGLHTSGPQAPGGSLGASSSGAKDNSADAKSPDPASAADAGGAGAGAEPGATGSGAVDAGISGTASGSPATENGSSSLNSGFGSDFGAQSIDLSAKKEEVE